MSTSITLGDMLMVVMVIIMRLLILVWRLSGILELRWQGELVLLLEGCLGFLRIGDIPILMDTIITIINV